MSTIPTPAGAPLAVSLTGGTVSEVLSILQDALNVAAVIPASAPAAALASVIFQIITAAVSRVQSETGKPLDLSKIPYEAPLP
jgi:hypothetical protein